MASKKELFQSYIMSFSYRERRKKRLEEYRKNIALLKKMPDDELEFEYITRKSEYEHKKNVLTLFMITFILAILMDIWNNFWSFMEKAFQYATVSENNGIEVFTISFALSVIIAMAVIFVIILILFTYTRELRKLRQELLIIENLRNQQTNTPKKD